MRRDDILNRYRHLRAITKRQHSAILDYVAQPTLLERARELGRRGGKTVVCGSEEEVALVMDLAIHTAKPRRSRAIERYAKAASLPAGSDEAFMLDAMIASRFSIWDVQVRHGEAGLIIKDTMRRNEPETWLVDEGLELSAPPGMMFAARLYLPAEFAMTSGVMVPIDPEIVDAALDDLSTAAWDAPTERLANDPRFAAAIYRAAIDGGVMDDVQFMECGMAA